jgi:hypothetical protein
VEGPTAAAAQGAIHVLATTLEGTRAALATAIPLARGSGSRLIVIVPKVVSYAVPADLSKEPSGGRHDVFARDAQ